MLEDLLRRTPVTLLKARHGLRVPTLGLTPLVDRWPPSLSQGTRRPGVVDDVNGVSGLCQKLRGIFRRT